MAEVNIWDVLLIIGGFVLLIKGADLLVSGASSLAKKLKVSDLAIGLTIVAMGTSAPELVINILSGSHEDPESTDLIFGNIIGSNIFNTFLILGIASIIFPLEVKGSVLRKDMPYCVGGLIVLLLLINDSWFFPNQANALSFWDGIILLVGFAIFLAHTFINIRKGIDVEEEDEEIKVHSILKSIILIVLGMAGLGFGGKFVVDGAVHIAEALEVDKEIIGLTILAGGTSLPELATSGVAAFNRKADLAVGNVIGSNIFNILMVLAITGVLTSSLKGVPLPYDAKMLNLDMYITFAGMILLMVFMYTFRRRKIDRIEGMILLLGFLGYAYLIYTRL